MSITNTMPNCRLPTEKRKRNRWFRARLRWVVRDGFNLMVLGHRLWYHAGDEPRLTARRKYRLVSASMKRKYA